MKFAFSFLFICTSLLLLAQSEQQISFNQLSVNDGLSQNSVVSIAQDETGYLWFATQDGLNKYDGRQFKYYDKHFEDITRDNYSRLGKIYIDTQDQLYIITKNGQLERYDRDADSFVRSPGIPNVSTIHQDANAQTWIGTYGNGLYKIIDSDTIQQLNNTDLLRETYAIADYKKSVIVASTGGLLVFNDLKLGYEQLRSTSSETINYSSLAVLDDQLWVGSFGNGLFQMSPSEENIVQFKGFGEKQSLPTNLNIESLLVDAKDRLWIGTYGDGAYLVDFNKGRIRHFITDSSNPGTISYNDILTLLQDNTGTIWLGTDGGGLSYYDENLNKFNILTNNQTPNFAKVDVVRAITVDNENTVWIGTSGKGLTNYIPSAEKFNSYTETGKPPLGRIPSNRVMSLLSDSNDLWIGFQDAGLAILNKGKVTHYNASSKPFLKANTVWCIYKDSSDLVWLGTGDGGLIQFDKYKGIQNQYVRALTKEASISSNNVRAIEEGAEGELWIGTESSGINRFFKDTGTFTQYDQPALQNVKSLHYNDGILWVGTNGQGLVRFNTESLKLEIYDQKDGLPNNVVYGILPDAANNLWLSSNRGISNLQFDTANVPVFTNYDIYDGLQSYEFNTGAAFKDVDGTLYFGGLKGINWFQPETLRFNTSPPETILTSLEIFNEKVKIIPDATYAHNQNTMSFYFAGLHYSQPERNSYKYTLEGYDTQWSKANNTNFAHYAKLPPGDYTFKVLSSNYDDVWGNSPASYAFTIKSPWYWTTLAKLGYLLLFLTLIYLVYKYFKSRWQMQLQLRLEHAETDRLKKLDELKSKLYTNISHEFRTPLTLISGPVQQLLGNSQLTSNDVRALNIIEGSSERMLRLVNQLLDLSKLEEGSVQLQVGQYDMTPQMSQILEAFSLEAGRKGITIVSRLEAIDDAWYDKDALEKIVSNLLSNAVKYAPENTSISFITEKKQDFLHIAIENENRSLNESDLPLIYNRFFQADKNSEGVGIGLSLIKELVILANGSISVKKKTAKSISFEVLLPIAKNLYNANNLISEARTYDFIPTETSQIFEDEPEERPILLVVEDNLEVRSYIVSLFVDSFEIFQAENGLVGITKAIEQIPDVIISDIMMPEKDGVELCNTLKQDSRTSHIPILLLTAKAGDTAILEGLQNQADDYITKPFNPNILTQKVKNIILAQQALQRRYSQHVYLSPKEIAVTSYDETFFEGLQAIINTHITESDFSSEDFAKALGLSRMQLHRKLKALTGLSTSEFIRSQRLKTSLKLLEDSDLSVSEVAYSVGFNTPSYFIKCFKEAYKTTPAAYFNK